MGSEILLNTRFLLRLLGETVGVFLRGLAIGGPGGGGVRVFMETFHRVVEFAGVFFAERLRFQLRFDTLGGLAGTLLGGLAGGLLLSGPFGGDGGFPAEFFQLLLRLAGLGHAGGVGLFFFFHPTHRIGGTLLCLFAGGFFLGGPTGSRLRFATKGLCLFLRGMHFVLRRLLGVLLLFDPRLRVEGGLLGNFPGGGFLRGPGGGLFGILAGLLQLIARELRGVFGCGLGFEQGFHAG